MKCDMLILLHLITITLLLILIGLRVLKWIKEHPPRDRV